MSHEHHPDYDEIDRLEHALFPEWFAEPVVVPEPPEADRGDRVQFGRKNPDWRPDRATILGAARQSPDELVVAPGTVWQLGSSAVAVTAQQMKGMWENEIFYGARLRGMR